MTVRELISALSGLPGDAPVYLEDEGTAWTATGVGLEEWGGGQKVMIR